MSRICNKMLLKKMIGGMTVRWKTWVVVALAMLMTFSGCINYSEETVLKNNGSGTMKIQYDIDESMVTMMEQGEAGVDNPFNFDKEKVIEQFKSKDKNVTVKKVEAFTEEGKRNILIALAFKDINKLPQTEFFQGRQFSFKKGDKGVLVYQMVLPASGNEDDEDSEDETMMQAMFNNYTFKFTLELPSKVIESNGKIDKNKVVWEIPLASAMQGYTMEAKIAAGPNLVIVLGSLGVMLLVVIVILLIVLKGCKPKTVEEGQEPAETV